MASRRTSSRIPPDARDSGGCGVETRVRCMAATAHGATPE